jgi:mannose-1-phosphate guanylyltransferase
MMQAFILAGGLGTRLRAALPDLPKPLAPVAGRPFITHLLCWLRQQDINRVTLCLGYQAQAVIDALGGGAGLGLQLSYSVETEPLGTGGALKLASRDSTGSALVLNGDTFFDFELAGLFATHRSTGAWVTLALKREASGLARGCAQLAEDGRIRAFVEKPETAREALISAGVYVFEPEAFAHFPVQAAFSLEREYFPGLAAAGRLAGHVAEGYFVDIGAPAAWQQFERDLLEGRVHDCT